MITSPAPAVRVRPLSDATLHHHRTQVAVPGYDRDRLRPGVVHLGVGGFHRAHQGVYFDDLARAGVSGAWGVTGVSLRHRGMQAALAPQDGLYTVIERGAEGERARVVGTLRRTLFAPLEREAVLATLADPATHLVTLTITGDGYHLDPDTGALDAGDPAIRTDLEHPGAPTTALGHIVEALARRRRAGRDPFTVLSCDNIPDNGRATRTAVVSFAALRDEVLARWIENHVAFPGSMVDRITPPTTAADRSHVARRYGVGDRWPVITEPFTQWVVEDRFCAERPPLERVGVQMVDDVAPYRLTKTRLLNASHSALGYLGTLAGHRRTDEAMADPALRDYVARLLADEIGPLVPEVPGLCPATYRRTLLDRLSNPAIADPLGRLCERGSTKLPAYLLPSLREALAAGSPCELLLLAVAAWMRHLRGTDLQGRAVAVRDGHGERLRALALHGGDDPRPLLSQTAIFGRLGEDARVVTGLRQALRDLDRDGVHGAVRLRTDAGLRPAAA
jgi:mannitol-1-phosphate/altronate dehydrogenase